MQLSEIEKAMLNLQSVDINPFMLNGISHCYQLEQSISGLRDVGW